MELPNFFVAIKIYEYYPDRACIISIYDDKSKMWSAGIFKYENGIAGMCLYSLDEFIYGDENTAVHILKEIVESFQPLITAMSN